MKYKKLIIINLCPFFSGDYNGANLSRGKRGTYK